MVRSARGRSHHQPRRDSTGRTGRQGRDGTSWWESVVTAALGLGFSCSVALSAVVMWVVGATAFLAVVVAFAVAWLTACSMYRRCCGIGSGVRP